MKRQKSISSPSTSSELNSSEDDFNFDEEPPASKKVKRKGGEGRNSIIEARKIRNRQAAQASRDRKKSASEYLEKRVVELEEQLLNSTSTNQLPSTPVPTLLLEHENNLLRSQLKLEELQSANLRLRLNSLEDKFSRLEALITLNNSPALNVPISVPSTSTIQHEKEFITVDVTGLEVKRVEESAETNLVESTIILDTTPFSQSLSNSTSVTDTSTSITPYQLDDLTISQIWGEWSNGLENEVEEKQDDEFIWSDQLFSFESIQENIITC